MSTREIAREGWQDFFDAFSRRHDAWLVAVEALGLDIGAQTEGRDLRLRGISLDKNGSRVSLMFETVGGEHLTHTIAAPVHVWVEQAADGADVALQIESADQISTLVRFRVAVRPEMVDGVMTS